MSLSRPVARLPRRSATQPLSPLVLSALGLVLSLGPLPLSSSAAWPSGTVFKVQTRPNAPLLFENQGQPYTGFMVDLFDSLAEALDFQYEMVVTAKGAGAIVSDVETQAQGAVVGGGDIFITSSRQEQVYFMQPFMKGGARMAVRKPQQESSLWAIFQPFEMSAWLVVIVCVFCFMLAHFLHSVVSDSGPDSDPWYMKLGTSAWWSISSLFGAGEEAPQGVAGRCFQLAYLFFFTIILSAYTATLAAKLAQTALNPALADFSGLKQGHKVCVGAGGVVETTVREDVPAGVKVLAASADECLALVQSGEYDAFVFNSARIEYAVTEAQWCDLMVTGGFIAPHDFGLFVNKNFSYSLEMQDKFSQHLLHLRLSGELDRMINKWWLENSQCDPPQAIDPDKGLEFEGLKGLIIVVGSLMGIGMILLGLEWYLRNQGVKSPAVNEVLNKAGSMRNLTAALESTSKVVPVGDDASMAALLDVMKQMQLQIAEVKSGLQNQMSDLQTSVKELQQKVDSMSGGERG